MLVNYGWPKLPVGPGTTVPTALLWRAEKVIGACATPPALSKHSRLLELPRSRPKSCRYRNFLPRQAKQRKQQNWQEQTRPLIARLRGYTTTGSKSDKMVKSKSDDVQLSLRLKHGLITIFLLVDAQDTFDKITSTLLSVLRERYPDGLDGGLVPIPQGDDFHVAYGMLKKPQDTLSGWSDLNVAEGDTPASRGVKDNTPLAFAFVGDEDDEPTFKVEFPRMEYEGEGDDDMAE